MGAAAKKTTHLGIDSPLLRLVAMLLPGCEM